MMIGRRGQAVKRTDPYDPGGLGGGADARSGRGPDPRSCWMAGEVAARAI